VLSSHAPACERTDNARRLRGMQRAPRSQTMSVTVVPQPLVPRLVGRLLDLLVYSVEGLRSRRHRSITL